MTAPSTPTPGRQAPCLPAARCAPLRTSASVLPLQLRPWLACRRCGCCVAVAAALHCQYLPGEWAALLPPQTASPGVPFAPPAPTPPAPTPQGCTAVHKLKDNLKIFTELVSVFPPRELRDNYLVQVPACLSAVALLAAVSFGCPPRICCRSSGFCSAASHPITHLRCAVPCSRRSLTRSRRTTATEPLRGAPAARPLALHPPPPVPVAWQQSASWYQHSDV